MVSYLLLKNCVFLPNRWHIGIISDPYYEPHGWYFCCVLGARILPQVPHVGQPIFAVLRKEKCISGKCAIWNSNGCLSPSGVMVPTAKKTGLLGWPEDVALSLCCYRTNDRLGDTHCPRKWVYCESFQAWHWRGVICIVSCLIPGKVLIAVFKSVSAQSQEAHILKSLRSSWLWRGLREGFLKKEQKKRSWLGLLAVFNTQSSLFPNPLSRGCVPLALSRPAEVDAGSALLGAPAFSVCTVRWIRSDTKWLACLKTTLPGKLPLSFQKQ